ncbi:hypothetical protein PVK06_045245 [Gossypium arboreum]|uniref:pectinesterase n=1 Tax=Gossypium arboreum TaxID=29729 RepID=A0ABR0MTJ1_GOSAR|nr:hypothetical protein PVK06_045245 [Gossypium arboreum]
MPNLTFDGTVKQYGTVDGAAFIIESSYFVGANLNIVNTPPRPDGKMVGAQAVALRVSGDRSAFYNCKIIGFQDILFDDRGNHFFKDCHIRGTVDFIFRSGTFLYLNSEIFVEGDLEGDPEMAVITIQARKSSSEDTGYSFAHGRITETANDVFLGRAWKSSLRVVYSYTEMDEIVHPGGCTVYYGEYKCTGKASTPATREKFVKQLSDAEAQPFLVLDYVEDKSQVEAWFNSIIKPVKERGKTLDPELVEAKTEPRIIKVMQSGGGEFNTITKAIESVPSGNAKRNTAPRPDGKKVGVQVVALRVSGDRLTHNGVASWLKPSLHCATRSKATGVLCGHVCLAVTS